MPIIHVEMLAGRPTEVKQELAEQLTEAVVKTLGVSPEKVRVLYHEVDREHWFVGGHPIGAPQTTTPSLDKSKVERETPN